MMARVGRLAGALLVQTGKDYFMVGDTKEPCDFTAAGFDPPGEIDFTKHRYIKLTSRLVVDIREPHLELELEGEALAKCLSERLLIERNGSVSERLWRMLFDPSGEHDLPADGAVNVTWLAEIPNEIWQVVRDAVLRCR